MEKNVFDTFLESLSDDGVRRGLSELALKEPKLKDAFMAQSDYSRKLDEHRDDLEELNGWRGWRNENWISGADGKGMTKAEQRQADRLRALEAERQELETKLAEAAFSSGGEEVTFEQLSEQLGTLAKERGLVDNARLEEVIKSKTGEVEELVKNSNRIVTTASLLVPYLNQKHRDEFGETFNPLEFVQQAHQAGQYDLQKFYDQWSEPKRMKKERDEFETKLKAQTEQHAKELEEARKEGAASRSMSAGSEGMPVDTEGGLADVPAFQRKYLQLDRKDGEGNAAPPEGKLGDNSVAAFAAREFARKPVTA
jgi:hypothetical protein